MKKITALVLVMLLVTSFAGCNKQKTNPPNENADGFEGHAISTLSVSVGEGYIPGNEDDGTALHVDATFPVVRLSYEDAEKYPALSNVLEELAVECRQEQEQARSDLQAFVEDTGIEVDGSYLISAQREAFVRRADSRVFSILMQSTDRIEGTRDEIYYTGKTFDTQTGKVLSIEDVVTDVGLLPDIIEEQLHAFWSDLSLSEEADLAEIIQAADFESWVLDYTGLTLVFNPLVLAPYSHGAQTVTLLFEQYPNLVKEAYTQTPQGYGFQVTKTLPQYLDVNGDKKADELIISSLESVMGEESMFSLYVNGRAFSEDVGFFYDASYYVIRTKDGQQLLCGEYLSDNDYRTTYYFKLDDAPEMTGYIFAGLRGVFHETPDCPYLREVLTCPSAFYMESRTQLGGTACGEKKYTIDASGMPKSIDFIYVIDEQARPVYTLLCDVPAKIYDEKSGSVQADTVLEEGLQLSFYGTDDERFLYFTDFDYHRMYRVEVQRVQGQPAINGTALDSVFDGIVYAG